MVKDINKLLQTITELLNHVTVEYKDELKLDKILSSNIEEIKQRLDTYTSYKNNFEELLESIERTLKYAHAIKPAITLHDQTLQSLRSTLLEEFPHLKERL